MEAVYVWNKCSSLMEAVYVWNKCSSLMQPVYVQNKCTQLNVTSVCTEYIASVQIQNKRVYVCNKCMQCGKEPVYLWNTCMRSVT